MLNTGTVELAATVKTGGRRLDVRVSPRPAAEVTAEQAAAWSEVSRWVYDELEAERLAA